jgi:hypothetical protein
VLFFEILVALQEFAECEAEIGQTVVLQIDQSPALDVTTGLDQALLDQRPLVPFNQGRVLKSAKPSDDSHSVVDPIAMEWRTFGLQAPFRNESIVGRKNPDLDGGKCPSYGDVLADDHIIAVSLRLLCRSKKESAKQIDLFRVVGRLVEAFKGVGENRACLVGLPVVALNLSLFSQGAPFCI